MIDPSDHFLAFAGLRDRDYARAGLIVCEGRIVIQKALDCGIRLRSLVCVPADEEEWRGVSASVGPSGGFSVASMGRAEMADLLGFSFHRGAMALADRPASPVPATAPAGHALALWNVTDPDNLGALIRSAAALGASRIYLGPGCADPYSRKALRASMACALGLPIVPLTGLEELPLCRGPSGNLLVAAALVPGALEPRDVPTAASGRPITLLLGNEGWGLPAEIVAACDERVIVPMAGHVDSLNVGAAGAILMWELFRRQQREYALLPSGNDIRAR
ncbi:MAG: hypothetical protein A2Y38_23210 [Spirochaetes bacterium GWB1_59_5]|nr:MAG: hypothetical protein A2Y38_23210 [Spirochaetes bacterium GWB1_59_5]